MAAGTDGQAFAFRRALPGDREAVLALCAKIWEGDDYIPTCFDRWVADEEGELALCFSGTAGMASATDSTGSADGGSPGGRGTGPVGRGTGPGGRLVGLAKLTWLGPGEAWLEGLRKDPDCGLHGVGKALCARFLAILAAKARDGGLASLHFSTYFSNAESIALNQALGFREVARASMLHAEPRALAPETFAGVETITDPGEFLGCLRSSTWFGSYIHEAWKTYAFSEGRFVERYLAQGSCVGIREGGRLVAAMARRVNAEKAVGAITFLHAPDDALAARLLSEASASFAEAGIEEMECALPEGQDRCLGQLKAAGFSSWERLEDYLLFEYPLDKLLKSV